MPRDDKYITLKERKWGQVDKTKWGQVDNAD